MDTESSEIQSLSHAISQHIQKHWKSNRPLSMRDALDALRKSDPDCALSDRELIDLIAAAAIQRNISVHFDVDTSVSSKTSRSA